MRRRPLLAVTLSLVLLAGLVAGLLIYSQTRAARAQIRALLETVLSRELEMPLRIGRFSFSPALNRVEARSLTLLPHEGAPPLLTVDRIRVVVDLLALLRGRVEIRSVLVDGPRLSVEDSDDLRQRLQQLASRLHRLGSGAAAAGVPVTVENAMLRYHHAPLALSAAVDRLRLALRWPAPERAHLTLQSDAASLAFGGREIKELHIEGDLAVTSERVEATRFQVAKGGSALSFGGTIFRPDQSPTTELHAAGALDVASLASVLGLSGSWDGLLRVQGSLAGERFPPEFRGTLAVAAGVLRGLPLRQAEARVVLGRERLTLIAFSARTEDGSLSGSGSFEPGHGGYDVSARLDDVSLKPLLHAAGRPETLLGRLTGRVEGHGRGKNLAEFVGLGEVRVSGLHLEGSERRAEVSVRGTTRKGLLFVDRLSVRSGSSDLSGRGSVALATGAIDLQLRASVARLEHDLWPHGIAGLGGRLTAAGRVSRRLQDPVFVGQVKGQNLRVGAMRLDVVEGPLEADRQRMASRGLRTIIGSSVATLSGEARLPDLRLWPGSWRENLTLAITAQLSGRAEDLGTLLPASWPLVGGPLSLQLSAKGSPGNLSGSGRMEMREVRVGEDRWEFLRADLAFTGRDLTVPQLTLRRRGVTIQAEGRIDLAGRYSVAAAPVALDLAHLPRLGELGAKGMATVKVWGNGELAQPRLEGELSLRDGVIRGLALGNGTGTFLLDRGQWRWALRLASGYDARGIAPLGLVGPFTASISAVNADLGPFLSGLKLRFPLSARADGSATLEGELPALSGLSGEIELLGLRGQAGEIPWQSRGAVRLRLSSGAIRIDPLALVGPGLSVMLRGVVKPGEHTEVVLAGRAPFAIIEPWAPPVAAVRGDPEIRLILAGRPGALAVNGIAELQAVDVRLKALPLWLSVGRGEVTFSNDRVRFRVADGATAGGRLEGQGEAQRQDGRWVHTLEFSLERAEIGQLYDQWMAKERWASGTLSLKSSVTFEAGAGLSPMRTLGGKVAMIADGGSISRYPAQPTLLPDLPREQMPYRRITGDFAATQGVLESKNLVLDSEVARLSGIGKISLPDRTLDLDVALRPLQVLEQGIRRIPLFGRVLPEEQSLGVVYFDVKGPWSDPHVSVAPIKTLGQSVVEILLLLLRAPDRLLIPQTPSVP